MIWVKQKKVDDTLESSMQVQLLQLHSTSDFSKPALVERQYRKRKPEAKLPPIATQDLDLALVSKGPPPTPRPTPRPTARPTPRPTAKPTPRFTFSPEWFREHPVNIVSRPAWMPSGRGMQMKSEQADESMADAPKNVNSEG